jgi:signal transduction histidine kinase
MMNVVKHAQASHARVRIIRNGESVSVQVEDDGVGMGDAVLNKKGSFGLFSIRERLHYLGGSLQIESDDGSGTKMTLTVPLHHLRTSQMEEQPYDKNCLS